MTGSFAALRAFHWRTRSFLLFGAGATALAAGVLVARPALLYLALPLLLAPVAAALLGPFRRADGADALGGGRVGAGRTSRRHDIVRPADGRPGHRHRVRRTAGASRGRSSRIARSGHEIRFRLHWTAPEPVVVPVPFPRLTWRDPAGLVEWEVRWNPSDLLVERYPAELVHIGAVRLERTIAAPGETRSRRIGPDGEFFGIRYASPFEPPRRINWPATARTGQLMVNEFQLERTGDILLLIDTRPSTLGPWVDTELLSLSVAAAYGIAESFLREKARVGLGVYGEFLDAVPLSAGRTQRVRLRNALMRVRLSRNPGPTERCAVSLRRYFPPGVTTILLSSLVDNESRYLVPYIRRRGFPVVVLSPSALPILTARPTLSASDEELVTRMARLLRRDRLARTWEDAPVVDWEEYWSLGGLVDILRRPGRRGRVI